MRNLEEAFEQCKDRSLVLLIDEYDAPLTHVLNDVDEFKMRHAILRDFFSLIKRFNSKFRFGFITGVTKISSLGLFSGPNNIRDITFDSLYGSIAGITQQELEQNLKPYIANAAKALRKIYPDQGWNNKKVLERLKLNYDGYSFDERAQVRVYNPWSVLNFLASPHREFKPYWLGSGAAASSLLFNSLDRVSKSGNSLRELCEYLAPGLPKKAA